MQTINATDYDDASIEKDGSYNGWDNYETWRVRLEIFDGFNPSDYWCMDDDNLTPYDLGQLLKNYAEELIEMSSDEGLARDYALAFLSAVNWTEIARHMIDDYLAEQGVTK